MSDAFTLTQDHNVSEHEFADLLSRSTLAERRPTDLATLAGMLAHADVMITARLDSGTLIGISRAITDFHYCTYLSDLAVDAAYQRQGIGKALIDKTHEVAGKNTTLILLAAPAAKEYYPRIGMQPHDSCWLIKAESPEPATAQHIRQQLSLMALVVDDYDEAIDYFTNTLDFQLVEDTYQPEQDKRWVVVAPPGPGGASLLLARASNERQQQSIGNQTGGRVFLFLETNDFHRDHQKYLSRGVEFVRPPKEEPFGTVAVFQDRYGNLWDLIQRR